MYTPSSTYRIQFNKDFTLGNLKENLPYFSMLGAGSIYASPVFAAVPESMHGYDVMFPHIINPEIGSLQELEDIHTFLKTSGMGWIQDIVPNHMAFHSGNPWLMDVLENGRDSSFASFFDIDFNHPALNGKIIVPFLGKPMEESVREKEIQLTWVNGRFFIDYYSFILPVNTQTLQSLLQEKQITEKEFIGQGIIMEEYRHDLAFNGIGFTNMQERFNLLYEQDYSFKTSIDELLESVNNDPDKMTGLLDKQHYKLSYWRDVEDQINYRRFFTINGLISLRMEKDEVFDEYHKLINRLVKEDMFQGLRIDHIDGLRNPNLYFENLRKLVGDETYIVVEKILEQNEELEKNWDIQGSSGYDFLAIVNNLFTRSENYPKLQKFYNEITGTQQSTEDIIYEKKKLILTQSLRGDWENLIHMLENTGLVEFNEEVSFVRIMEAVGEFLAACPVYKLYSDSLPLSPEDRTIVKQVIDKAVARTGYLKKPLKILQNIFLDEYEDKKKQEAALDFFLRCMQYTGPLMAKGVEDTAMYSYACFIAHNEVGDAMDANGISIDRFHTVMKIRRRNLPASMNATSTHDTKRGEDSRARLNVISELPDEWIALVQQWMQQNEPLKKTVSGKQAPSHNEEYFIYQTLAGVIPMDGSIDDQLLDRLNDYMRKALKEAKVNSDWNQPDTPYEDAVVDFIRQILKPESNFLSTFYPFLQKISHYGIINSLSQLVLKCTCPGIPDFYQGTEMWDLSLVDPDNRRAVNYDLRMAALMEWQELTGIERQQNFFKLLEDRADGKIKLWFANVLLSERSKDPVFFTNANYIPLSVTGRLKDHVLAFARASGNKWYITIVPLFVAGIYSRKIRKVSETTDWRNTVVQIPESAPKQWLNLLDNQEISCNGEISLNRLLDRNCPVVLKGTTTETGRSAGILLHISSLPGKYGTGDLGNEAYNFVDFLAESGQAYWQILPLNPAGGGHSPYSSPSAFAGNTVFISPDTLLKWRLIHHLPEEFGVNSHSAMFERAGELRSDLLREAFLNFKMQHRPLLQKRFEDFCEKEKYWLDDFALFTVIKKESGNKFWDQWPVKLRDRDDARLQTAIEDHRDEIEQEKFSQFLFDEQWKQLKKYAHSKGIRIIGDMSFYVSYDSAELWANPQLFKLDDQKKMISVAGVPPDYFSETGQLWNMPIYDWEVMKDDGYSWWKNRIRRNLEFCDLVRFDHFRGLSAYWEVPAGETTAVNGRWNKGPAYDFFTEIKKDFPSMPFIAEDLGEIDDDVYNLRDDFELPGMKVLQFAFGNDMPASVHIPHMHNANSIAYTGTHDNNTIRGWYKKDLDEKSRKNVQSYLFKKLTPTMAVDELIRMVYASVSRIAIIPVQDILRFDTDSRLNDPSKAVNNWTWKLVPSDLRKEESERLQHLSWLYGRK